MAAIPGYYNPQEAADIIGVSYSQVCNYVNDGKLKPVIRLGKQILIEQKAVHEFERPKRGNPDFLKQGAHA